MRVELREIDFLLKRFAELFDCVVFVETNYMNTKMCKSDSSQSHENRAQQIDSSKVHNKPELLFVALGILCHNYKSK